ncbi:pantoate--beta-alanine ligase [Dysgonomonas massiliensis]|uniref:pantoate--beta-alanine ligase n=1 Tax=Dysgonomonas massiliensis TaxID=2040292 RepID=UPI000C75B3B7|nr:pantoate--beta-alanine ligase [Dysgonomonas massiliensis]
MKIVTSAKELNVITNNYRKEGKTIGLVPTMGALHAGHFSLVKESLTDNDITIVSIFVNPTQFNDKSDLEKYPRDLDRDSQGLQELSDSIIVFAPTVEEIYPEPDTRVFDFGMLDKVMEGKHRPGHFNGVAQVVSRLFYIVNPHKAYFGQKDFQQLAIIRAMVKQLGMTVQIVPMPIIRVESGLALSSRNERLSNEQKDLAVNISKALFDSAKMIEQKNVSETAQYVIDNINKYEGLDVEYFEIVDGNSLQQVNNWSDSDYIVGCITVFCGDIRLIDNIIYKNEQ